MSRISTSSPICRHPYQQVSMPRRAVRQEGAGELAGPASLPPLSRSLPVMESSPFPGTHCHERSCWWSWPSTSSSQWCENRLRAGGSSVATIRAALESRSRADAAVRGLRSGAGAGLRRLASALNSLREHRQIPTGSSACSPCATRNTELGVWNSKRGAPPAGPGQRASGAGIQGLTGEQAERDLGSFAGLGMLWAGWSCS
jgi:hypothetical protein